MKRPPGCKHLALPPRPWRIVFGGPDGDAFDLVPGWIVTQGVMIIEVFITVGETVDALAQLLELGMFDAFGSRGMASLMAWVSPKRRSIWRRSRIPPALEMSAPPKPASIRRRSKLGKVN